MTPLLSVSDRDFFADRGCRANRAYEFRFNYDRDYPTSYSTAASAEGHQEAVDNGKAAFDNACAAYDYHVKAVEEPFMMVDPYDQIDRRETRRRSQIEIHQLLQSAVPEDQEKGRKLQRQNANLDASIARDPTKVPWDFSTREDLERRGGPPQ
jgi:hypothetical protein